MAHDWSMSTSTRGGLTLGLPATGAAVANWPARASTLGSLINNLNHLADERSRVLVSYAQRAGAGASGGGREAGAGVADTWVRIYSWGPFPILVGHDGLPYPIRVRVGGFSVDGQACLLRIGVAAWGTAADVMSVTTAGADVVESASFTDDTRQWRAGGLVTMSAQWSDLGVVDAVSGATVSVSAVLASIEVWGSSSDGSAINCSSAYAAEQVRLIP